MVKTPRGGSGYEEEKQGKTKWAWGEGTLSWAFRGALGLYFFLETEATEKFMHEGPLILYFFSPHFHKHTGKRVL